MTLYSGMNNTSGKVITDIDHLRQSVRDILLTPQGTVSCFCASVLTKPRRR